MLDVVKREFSSPELTGREAIAWGLEGSRSPRRRLRLITCEQVGVGPSWARCARARTAGAGGLFAVEQK